MLLHVISSVPVTTDTFLPKSQWSDERRQTADAGRLAWSNVGRGRRHAIQPAVELGVRADDVPHRELVRADHYSFRNPGYMRI